MADELACHVSAWWTSDRTGLAKCDSAPNALHFSEAEASGGLAGRWSPADLLLSSLAACFITTFEEVARKAKFAYTDLEVEAEGRVSRENADYAFTQILLRPKLTVQSEEEIEEGMSLLRRTRSMCQIARAISVPQTAQLKVEAVKAPSRACGAESEMKQTV